MLPYGSSRQLEVAFDAKQYQPGKAREQDGNDAATQVDNTAGTLQMLSGDFGLMGTGDAATVDEVLHKLASRNTEARLESLCDSLGLAKPADRAALKKAFHDHMTGSRAALTKEEDAALKEQAKNIVEMARKFPGAKSKSDQAINLTQAAAIAWAFSFVPLTVTISASGKDLGADSLHFFASAGPLIVLAGDVLAGAFIQQGAGYVPLDQLAYRDHHSLVSRLHELELKMAGVRDAGRKNTGEYKELEQQHEEWRIESQSVCTGLIKRELGQQLGIRKDANEADVPQLRMLRCIRSQLTAGDDGKVRFPDTTLLFTCEERGPSDSFQVTWADGTRTDLHTEPVPPQYQQLFGKAEGLLLGAARTRSTFCDEVPGGLSFTLFYGIYGVAAPFIRAMPDSAIPDAAANLAASFCSLQGAFHGGNAMLSWLSGANPASQPSAAEQGARFKHAELEVEIFKTRVGELDALRGRVDTELANLNARKARLNELIAAPQPGGPAVAALKEALAACEDQIALRKQAALHVKSHTRDATKALAKAELDREKAEGKLPATWAVAKETWKGYLNNIPRTVASVVGTCLPYVVLAEVFIRYVSMLMPGAPDAGQDGNATALNQTGEMPPEALGPYLSVAWMDGLQVALLFGMRHLVVGRALEYGIRDVAGRGEYLAARLGYGSRGVDDVLVTRSSTSTSEEDDAIVSHRMHAHTGNDSDNA